MHSYMLIINPTGRCFSTCAAQPVSAQSVFIKCPVLHVVILVLVTSLGLALCHSLFIPGTTFFFPESPPLFNLIALASPTFSCSLNFFFSKYLSNLNCKFLGAGLCHLFCVCMVMCILAVLSKNKCGNQLIISFPFEAEHNKGIAWFLMR